MELKNSGEIEIDISEIFFVLLYKLWIIIIAGILTATIAGVYSKYYIIPIYESTAQLYVINREYTDSFITWNDLESGDYLTQDYKILVKSRPVTEEVIRSLNLNLTHEELAGMISVEVPTDTRIVNITVSDPDPQIAKQLADAVAKVSSEQLVDVMQMEMVNIVEYGGLATYPSSPNLTRNIMLGGIVGAFIAIAIIVLMYLKNDSIKTAEDIERYLGMTTLSTIPLDGGISKKKSKMKQSKRKAA